MKNQHLRSEQAAQEHLDTFKPVQTCLEIATVIFLGRYIHQDQSQSTNHRLSALTMGRRKPRSGRTRHPRVQNEVEDTSLEPLHTQHEQNGIQEKTISMPFPNEMFHGSHATVKLPQCENQDGVRPEGQARTVDRKDLDSQQRALLKLFKSTLEPANDRKSSILADKGRHDAVGDKTANPSPQHDSQADGTQESVTLPCRPSRPAETVVESKNSRLFEVHRDLDSRHSISQPSQRQAEDTLSNWGPDVRLNKLNRLAEDSSLRHEIHMHPHNGVQQQRLSSNTKTTERLSLTNLGETEPLGPPSSGIYGTVLAPVGYGRPRLEKQTSLPKPVLKDCQNRERWISNAKKNVTFTRSTELRDEGKHKLDETAPSSMILKDQSTPDLLSNAEVALSTVKAQRPQRLPLHSNIARNAKIEMVSVDRAFKKLILSEKKAGPNNLGNYQNRTQGRPWMEEVQKHSEYSDLSRPLSEREADWMPEPTVGPFFELVPFHSLKRCRQDGENDWDIVEEAEERERRGKSIAKSALKILKLRGHRG